MLHANRGTVLEHLVDRAIAYYGTHDLALFERRHLPVRVLDRSGGTARVAVTGEAGTDYFGLWNGSFVDFEAKQTNKDFFSLSSFSKGQLARMAAVDRHGGLCFALVYLEKAETIYLLTAGQIADLKRKKRAGRLRRPWLDENCPVVPVVAPGYADFLAALSKKERPPR